MGYTLGPIDKTPSDFANYVYCGIQWAFLKSKWLNELIKNWPSRALMNKKKANLKKGRQNERLCMDWVLNKFNLEKENILFDGTTFGDNFLLSSLEVHGTKMLCKPDLIVNINGKKVLFEFKAVSDKRYLNYPEFDSDHAQVWCYTHIIGEFKPEGFYLIRYFINPFNDNSIKLKGLSPIELDSNKFRKLLAQYSEAITVLGSKDNIDPSDPEFKEIFNHPPDGEDKARKCTSCKFNNACKRGYRQRPTEYDWYYLDQY